MPVGAPGRIIAKYDPGAFFGVSLAVILVRAAAGDRHEALHQAKLRAINASAAGGISTPPAPAVPASRVPA